MKVQSQWLDADSTVLLVEYFPGWTWDDHHIVITKTLGERQPGKFIYVMADLSKGTFPTKGSAVAQHRDVGDNVLIIIITNNTFVKMISDIGIKMRKEEHLYRVVKTRAEAERVIAEHRSKVSLPSP